MGVCRRRVWRGFEWCRAESGDLEQGKLPLLDLTVSTWRELGGKESRFTHEVSKCVLGTCAQIARRFWSGGLTNGGAFA